MGCITFFSVLMVLICVVDKHYKQGSLFVTSKEVGLEVNAEKIVLENSCQSCSLKIADKTLENVFIFIYLGMPLINKLSGL